MIVLSLLLAAASLQPWERAVLEQATLEYRLSGAGEPVVFIHGGLLADGLEPLANSTQAMKYRVLTWHRGGYSRSPAGNAGVASQATQLAQLMRYLEIPRAHVVGHSSGGNIALQFALDHPERVQSLVLLEPALPVAAGNPGIASAVRIYQRGDRAGAVDAFMRAVAGAGWREPVDRELPLAFAQALADAPVFFEQELPAVRSWSFDETAALRIGVPVLAVMGGRSPEVSSTWPLRQAWLMAQLPDAEACVLPETTHLLALQQPRELAMRLRRFFERHPVAPQRTTAMAPE